MMFAAMVRVRETLCAVLEKLPMDSVEATALIEAVDELDDAMVADVRAGTYVEYTTPCQETR